ncbi:plasmid pRiA4b ORF-3 family protein [bacterium]|nr:plasmid pRiA4b ORF-3 family protein [bacterium]
METSNKIYQIKIKLANIKPPIWRKILVNSDILLPNLHKIIQTVMGWMNLHLHDFRVGKKYYGEIDEEDIIDVIDYSNVHLNKVMRKVKDHIVYMYDFGDGWEHKITLEKILEPEVKKYYPVCITGKRGCPPEDCGGSGGYENLLKILKDPKHPEYEDYKEWVGDYFFPEEFDIQTVNELLKSEDYGCIDLDMY